MNGVNLGPPQEFSLGDDLPLRFGGVADLLYETADANANALIFVAPEGGATDVPAFIFGDTSILNSDLGWFNGLTEPSLVVVNDAKDAYASLDAGDDAVAGSKGLYFKSAADEDIELINLSVTGTPRIFWDESEDAVSLPNITLGANKIKTTNYLIKDDSPYGFSVKTVADDAWHSLMVLNLNLRGKIGSQLDATVWEVSNADNNYSAVQARDNGVGLAEIMRWAGAADPYIQIGRDDTGVGLSAVTDMLVLQAGGGTGNEAANFGLGISMKIGNAASEVEERGSLDLVLATATNGSEDAKFTFNVMGAGAMGAIVDIDTGGINLASGKTLEIAGTKVVGARVVDARCDDAINSGDAVTDGVIDSLRDAMIAHGLIAAA